MDIPIRTRLITWRRARDLTQSGLAARVVALGGKVTGSAVSYWEAGKTSPSQANLGLVVAALGISMAEFYGPLPELPELPAATAGEHVA